MIVGLQELVNTWNSFNVDENITNIDMSDIAQVKKQFSKKANN